MLELMLILIKDKAFLDNSRIFKIMCDKTALKDVHVSASRARLGFTCLDIFLPVMRIRLCKNLTILLQRFLT